MGRLIHFRGSSAMVVDQIQRGRKSKTSELGLVRRESQGHVLDAEPVLEHDDRRVYVLALVLVLVPARRNGWFYSKSRPCYSRLSIRHVVVPVDVSEEWWPTLARSHPTGDM